MGKRKKKQPKRIVVERTHNAGTLTESQFFSKIRSALRSAFRYWKPMQIALEAASRKSQSKNKRLKKEYQCNNCKQWFPRKEVEIHHIIPCGSLSNYDDIVPFIKRLAAEGAESYAILCKACHKIETEEYKLNNKKQ